MLSCSCSMKVPTCSWCLRVTVCSTVLKHSGVLVFWGSFIEHLFCLGVSQSWGLSVQCFPPPPASFSLFTDLLSVMGACFLGGLMAGLPRVASHKSGLLPQLVGAGCQ